MIKFFKHNKWIYKLVHHMWLLISIMIVSSACTPMSKSSMQSTLLQTTLINNVTVVDTKTGNLSANMSLLLHDGLIAQIGPVGSIGLVEGMQVVDATDKYVVPGYLNMHVHLLDNDDLQETLTMMLVSGITGFRQMAGSPDLLRARRDGQLGIGEQQPELLALSGSILTPINTKTFEDARKNVQEQKAQGADFIKIGLLTPEIFFAVLDEAKKQNIPALGHLPGTVDVIKASAAGMRTIEHIGINFAIQAAASPDEEELLKQAPQIPGFMKWMPKFVGDAAFILIKPILENPYLKYSFSDKEFARLTRIIDSYDIERAKKIAGFSRDNGTWQVPTLVEKRSSELAFLPEYINNPSYLYLRPDARATKNKGVEVMQTKVSPENQKLLLRTYQMQLELIKLFADNNVPMLTGSDGSGPIVGPLLHDEFDELEKAGLSPLQVLQMATLNGAVYLGQTATMGSVEMGKQGDLVLLDANPIESVQNLHRIWGVIRGGYYYEQSELEKMKQSVLQTLNQ